MLARLAAAGRVARVAMCRAQQVTACKGCAYMAPSLGTCAENCKTGGAAGVQVVARPGVRVRSARCLATLQQLQLSHRECPV
jgi:hypothetical protein